MLFKIPFEITADPDISIYRESAGSHFGPTLTGIFCQIRREVGEVLGTEEMAVQQS